MATCDPASSAADGPPAAPVSEAELRQLHATLFPDQGLAGLDIEVILHESLPALRPLLCCGAAPVVASVISNLPVFCEQLSWYFPDNVISALTTSILPELYACESYISAGVPGIPETLSSLLSYLPSPDFVALEFPRLMNLLTSDNKLIRSLVCQVFENLVDFFGTDENYPYLLKLLNVITHDICGTIRVHGPSLIALYLRKMTNLQHRIQLASLFQLFVVDPSFNVRVAVAGRLPALSDCLTETTRSLFILPLLALLLDDSDELVMHAISKQLGMLIQSIGPIVDPSLIEKFCQTIVSSDPEIAYPSAYVFPAIALMLGPGRWSELQSDFVMATLSNEESVRRTLSHGLATYAFLIPQDILGPIVLSFLKDVPEIAGGLISNLFQMIRFLEPDTDLIFCLEDPYIKYRNWRIRLSVSQQLRYCADELNPDLLFPIARELLRDPVAIVRKDAAVSFAILFKPQALGDLEEIATDETYYFRQAAALVFRSFSREHAELAMPILAGLAHDPVVNVRVVAAQAAMELTDFVKANPGLDAIIEAMEQDEDDDVRGAVE
jgi:hypothetical protein